MGFHYERSDAVTSSTDDGVLRVTIMRAAKRNPLSLGVLEQIREIFTQNGSSNHLRLAIITGDGSEAFASGGDLVELADKRSAEDARALSLHGKAALNAVRRFPVPVVARVNGLALGGGAELALACDVRFAAAHAKFGFVHASLAISPSWGGSADLTRLVGYGAASRMMARAEVLSAEQAYAAGIFDGVTGESESFDQAFNAFVAPMISRPAQVMRAIKAAAASHRMEGVELRQALETDHFVATWTHQDHWAAADALAAKRTRPPEEV